MITSLLFVAAGVLALTFGGETLIRGALALGRRFGLSPLLAGLLIVGFGTSAPELAVAVDAALTGRPDIAVGSVVGSNISNSLLILGICACIRPLQVGRLTLQRDGVMVLVATLAYLALTLDGALRAADALLLLTGLAGYLGWAYWSETYRGSPAGEVHRAESESVSHLPGSLWLAALAFLGGLALLVVGSRLLLTGAVTIAEALGVSQALIGLTLVAVGTSLPELAVSVLAAVRNRVDVAVGNLLGSNLFNLFGILGISALLQPLPVPARIAALDQWVLLASALLVLAFLYTGRRLNRIEGGLLVLAYCVYVVYSFMIDAA